VTLSDVHVHALPLKTVLDISQARLRTALLLIVYYGPRLLPNPATHVFGARPTLTVNIPSPGLHGLDFSGQRVYPPH
jgi:hypothetical protein